MFGFVALPWWGYVIYTLICTHVTIVAVTVFLHRCQAHRALTLHPVVSHFFRLWLWLTTGMETKAWAAIHRKHHARCETPDDPHSPQVLGIWKVLLEGAELYRRESANSETLERFGKGTPDDWLERKLYHPYSGKGIFVTLFFNLIMFGWPGLCIWAVQMAWIPFFAAGVINGIGHYFGYRNFECPDAAVNIVPWGILIGGEELHNNHHTYPASAKLSVKWWEFDIGWGYIKLLSSLGLATVKRVSPKVQSIPDKDRVDLDTLKALISDRFQVMAQYSKSVLLPTFRQERSRMGNKALFARIKPALIREESLVDDSCRHHLEKFLKHSQKLRVVYQLRCQLQAIWNRTTATQKELIDALEEWCAQAEETRIAYLEDFVAYLRGFRLAVV